MEISTRRVWPCVASNGKSSSDSLLNTPRIPPYLQLFSLNVLHETLTLGTRVHVTGPEKGVIRNNLRYALFPLWMPNFFPDLGYTGKAGHFSESLKATWNNDYKQRIFRHMPCSPRYFKTQIYKVKYIESRCRFWYAEIISVSNLSNWELSCQILTTATVQKTINSKT